MAGDVGGFGERKGWIWSMYVVCMYESQKLIESIVVKK